jgi:hypothetical protein
VQPVVVSVDGPKTNDRTVTFRVQSGFDFFGVRIAYHYPSPSWDDWGRQAHDSKDIDIPASFRMPDLMVQTTISFDAAAKRIGLTSVNFYFDVAGDIGEMAQELVEAYYGASQVIQGIVDAVNASFPAGLPDTWDVADLTIQKVGGLPTGFSIALRATETEFDTI